MDAINILIATILEEPFRCQIADVHKSVTVSDATELITSELRNAREGKAAPDERKELDRLLGEAEVMLMFRPPLNLLARSPKLKWVQLVSAGIDRAIAGTGLLESDVMVTNASGIHATPIGEYVLGTMLMFAKKMPLAFANQQKRQWQRFTPSELKGKTVGVIGLGNIGREVARLARAFGMQVLATRRSAVKQELSVMGVDRMYPARDLLEMLGECDFVVLSLPLTRETTAIIGERELRAMKPSAFLVNISRGGIIDEPVLIQALKEGWIAGAGLDVFVQEPLPPESELWDLPNAILTPHIAGGSEIYNLRVIELFCENLRRYLDGQPLLNVVDKDKEY